MLQYSQVLHYIAELIKQIYTNGLTPTGTHLLPITTQLSAKCLQLYQSNPVYISIAQILIKAVSPYTTLWIIQMMDVLNPAISNGTDVEKCLALINHLNGLLTTDSSDDVNSIIDCYITAVYSGLLSNDTILETLINTTKVHKIYIIKLLHVNYSQTIPQILPLLLVKVSKSLHVALNL